VDNTAAASDFSSSQIFGKLTIHDFNWVDLSIINDTWFETNLQGTWVTAMGGTNNVSFTVLSKTTVYTAPQDVEIFLRINFSQPLHLSGLTSNNLSISLASNYMYENTGASEYVTLYTPTSPPLLTVPICNPSTHANDGNACINCSIPGSYAINPCRIYHSEIKFFQWSFAIDSSKTQTPTEYYGKITITDYNYIDLSPFTTAFF
jgi:hypothetical protein